MFQEQRLFALPVDYQPVEEALNHFISWLSRAEEVASNYKPLKPDLITLKDEEIAITVSLSCKGFVISTRGRTSRVFLEEQSMSTPFIKI